MSALRLYQIVVIAGFILLLEALCLAGVIDKITMPAPYIIARDFIQMLLAGRYFAEIGKSLTNVLVAFASAYFCRSRHRHDAAQLQDGAGHP